MTVMVMKVSTMSVSLLLLRLWDGIRDGVGIIGGRRRTDTGVVWDVNGPRRMVLRIDGWMQGEGSSMEDWWWLWRLDSVFTVLDGDPDGGYDLMDKCVSMVEWCDGSGKLMMR